MKPFGDCLKQLGFSGVVLTGLIVAATSSVGSATPVPVESASSQADSRAENSEGMLKPEDAIEPTASLPVVTAEATLRKTDPKPLLDNSSLAAVTPAEALSVSHSAADLLEVNRSNSQLTVDTAEGDLTLAAARTRCSVFLAPLVKGGWGDRNANLTGKIPPSPPSKGGNYSESCTGYENHIAAGEMQLSQAEPTPQPPATSKPAEGDLDLSPEIIENSPVLQRWRREVPNVLEEIRNDPSFRTRLRLGYSHFPSTGGGFNVGVEDVFLSRTGLTVSGDYHRSFNGKRESYGADLRYYVLPLGSYVNFAPQVGYRNLTTGNFSTDGVNVGARLMLALSRTGAADISVTQSFVSPGSSEEVGITTLSVGYAVTRNLRLSTDIQKQNSKEDKDSRVGIVLEWMP